MKGKGGIGAGMEEKKPEGKGRNGRKERTGNRRLGKEKM